MNGKILEFSADKYYNEGIAIGEQHLAKLIKALIANGKSDEIARAADDEAYRETLYNQYAIA